MSADSLPTVQLFSRALHDRNLDEARRLLHRDLVVRTAGGLPYSGTYLGPDGFFELFAAITEVLYLEPGPLRQQSLDDHTVVARFRLRFLGRSSGRQIDMDLVEIYQVSGGLIVELDVYYKDPSAVAALL